MGKTRSMRNKATMKNYYFPPEICTQILARLPAKSLLRLRCVSKTWCSIIEDPKFISMHLKLYRHNRTRTRILSVDFTEKGFIFKVPPIDSIKGTSLKVVWPADSNHDILGGCNGLYLLKDRCQCFPMRHVLWNPTVRKYLELPPCPRDRHDTYFRLGFAPSSNEYKLLAYCDDNDKLDVCTFGENSLTFRSLDDAVIDIVIKDVAIDMIKIGRDIIHFQGVSHMIVKMTYLASFNFDSEKFGILELPEKQRDMGHLAIKYSLFLLGESVAVFCIWVEGYSVWLLENETWRLYFSGVSSEEDFKSFTCPWYTESSCKIICVRKAGASASNFSIKSYNIGNHQVRQLCNTRRCYHYGSETYIESLVLHKGCQGESFL